MFAHRLSLPQRARCAATLEKGCSRSSSDEGCPKLMRREPALTEAGRKMALVDPGILNWQRLAAAWRPATRPVRFDSRR